MQLSELKLIFASNLIRLRTQAGMKQAELGAQLNYSDKSVSKWERGEAIPDAYVLTQLAEIFGVSVDALLTSHDKVTKPSVSYATKRLRESGYISLDPAGMIVLLPPGLEIAERMYERHKLLTELLIGLGVSPDTARRDACEIEHDLSEETFDAIRRHARKYR